MSRPVIAIGLDAADPQLLEKWMDQGHLPNMQALRAAGSFGRLETYDWYRAETPWTTFLTGVAPDETGYWSPIRYDADAADINMRYAFDFEEFPPFYAYLRDGVTVFDMPQAPLVPGLEGEQVLAWGTHSGQTDSVSAPEGLWKEIVDKHGPHPLLNNDGANCYDIESLKDLYERQKIGIQRRAKAFIDLIQTKKRPFALTIFGEAHVAGHYFWHLSQDHPLRDKFRNLDAPDLLLLSFKDMDAAVGEIVAAAPEDATIVVFSAHGMGPNVMDLPSVVFLPELMYRWCFPGEAAIAPGKAGGPVEPMIPVERMAKETFASVLWRHTKEANPLRTVLKKYLSRRFYDRLERHLPPLSENGKHVDSPYELRKRGAPQPYQPASWFCPFWSEMKAFALPSFSEGYVRINVKGRDKFGVVDPADYESVCNEVQSMLESLVDPRTGRKMVGRVVRTRQSLADETDKSPDADIVVVWQEDGVSDTIEGPNVGRIGPLPFLRTGSHRAGGFFMLKGPDAPPVRDGGHAVDLAPSFLKLMGVEIPSQMKGEALV